MKKTYRITDSISATMTERARNRSDVMGAVEGIARDLNAMLAYNPKRSAWIEVEWKGKGWLVQGKSKLPVEGPSITTDYLKRVPHYIPAKTKLTPVADIPVYALIIRATHERGAIQHAAIYELNYRGSWLTDEMKVQAGLTPEQYRHLCTTAPAQS